MASPTLQAAAPAVPIAEDLEDSKIKAGETPLDSDTCGAFMDGSVTDAVPRCASPSASSSTSGSHGEKSDIASDLVTDEMVEEEKRLEKEGEKEEEERKEKLLSEMTDDTRDKRYERLKFLLNKSTLYTEYLVGRMKKQKEAEEKKREKMEKRALKKQAEQAASKTQVNEEKNPSERPSRGGKRKLETDAKPKEKRQKRTKKADKAADSDEEEPQDDKKESEDEPKITDMAATYGVQEDVNTEGRTINGEPVPFLQPRLLEGAVLRPYQVEGYSWLKVLYENGVNGILADEMGLGKTIQAVAVLAHLAYMGVPGPFLVVAPLSTIPNWFNEFKRFAPKIPVVFYHGSKVQRPHLAARLNKKHEIRPGMFVKPVVITSYEVSMMDRGVLASKPWKYLVVDEGHRIKNTHCRLIRDLRMYQSTHRLLLTGTPLQNNLAELWSLLNFLLPEIFDDLGSFEAWFDVREMSGADANEQIVKQEKGEQILSMLHQILAPFMLRRLKTDVDLCIPPKKEVLVYAPLTSEQKQYYQAVVDRTIFHFIQEKNKDKEETEVEYSDTGRVKRRSIKKIDYSIFAEMEDDEKRNEKDDKIKNGKSKRMTSNQKRKDEEELDSWVEALDQMNANSDAGLPDKKRVSQLTVKMRNPMMQLRKCCSHPWLLEHPLEEGLDGYLALDERVVSSSGKMMLLDKMLTQLKARGHRVLIFSTMTTLLDLIEDLCVLRSHEFCRLDGSTSIDDRRQQMEVFNAKDSDKFCFLLSTRAGGLGINLVGADTVIIYDSDWNPQCDLQAQDRCHRIGQTRPVVVYRFVTRNTIDEKIVERAANKRKLEKMVILKGKFKSGNLMSKSKAITPEELLELLKSRDFEKEVNSENYSISKKEMNSLLDRSDLYEKWEEAKARKAGNTATKSPEKAKPAKAAQPSEGKGLFKVLDVTDSEQTKESQEKLT